MSRGLPAAAVALFVAAAPAFSQAPDPAAAERQYRIARRLAAEGSAKAAEAFRETVRLAPAGPLADDALVDEALLSGLPTFPDELGRLEPEALRASGTLLRRVVTELPGSDRAIEARYRAALLELEPSSDASQARVELLAIAGVADSPWSDPARYAVARIDERTGDLDRAAAAYHRLAIDRPGSPAALRARAGIGRILLRRGRHGSAAAWLQEAIDDGLPGSTGAGVLRDLAVRWVRRAASPAWRWDAAASDPLAGEGFRGVQALAPGPNGTFLSVDRKAGVVSRIDARGTVLERWTLDEPTAVATDPFGRIFAVAGDGVFRLNAGTSSAVASLERAGDASSLAVDDAGGFWILDRKGEKLIRTVEGGDPVDVRSFETGVSGIVWDGRRILAVEERGGRVFAIRPDRPEDPGETVASSGLKRAASIAVDPSGAILVADARSGECLLFDASGALVDRFRVPEDSGKRMAAATVTAAGLLVWVDGSRGGVEVVR